MARIVGKPISEDLFGSAKSDVMYGLDGDDFLYGGRDTLTGGGNDTFFGGEGNDYLYGGTGNDLFFHGAGKDAFVGGTGIDTVDYSKVSAGINVDMANSDRENGDFGDAFVGIERIIGSRFADTILGEYSSHTLFGGRGNDSIEGKGFADRLFGGSGHDTIRATETLDGMSDFGDQIYGGGGNDQIYGSDKLDRLSGGDGKDSIFGGSDADVIFGGSGSDWLAANRGDDKVYGGRGADTFWFSFSEIGARQVMDFKPWQGDNLYFQWGGNVTSLEELLPFLIERDGNLIVDFGKSSPGFVYEVIIIGAEIADLTAENVDFWSFQNQ